MLKHTVKEHSTKSHIRIPIEMTSTHDNTSSVNYSDNQSCNSISNKKIAISNSPEKLNKKNAGNDTIEITKKEETNSKKKLYQYLKWVGGILFISGVAGIGIRAITNNSSINNNSNLLNSSNFGPFNGTSLSMTPLYITNIAKTTNNLAHSTSPYSGYEAEITTISEKTIASTEEENNNNLKLKNKTYDGINDILLFTNEKITKKIISELTDTIYDARAAFYGLFKITEKENSEKINLILYKTEKDYRENEHEYANFGHSVFTHKRDYTSNIICTFIENENLLEFVHNAYIKYLDNKLNTFSIDNIEYIPSHKAWVTNLKWWINGLPEYLSKNRKKTKTIDNKNQIIFDIHGDSVDRHARIHEFIDSHEDMKRKNLRMKLTNAIRKSDWENSIGYILNVFPHYNKEYIEWIKTNN